MRLKDVQKPSKKTVPYTARIKKETRDYLQKNKVDLDKVVELLKLGEKRK